MKNNDNFPAPRIGVGKSGRRGGAVRDGHWVRYRRVIVTVCMVLVVIGGGEAC